MQQPYGSVTLAVLALLVVAGVGAQSAEDCAAALGSGCLQCENVTITLPPPRDDRTDDRGDSSAADGNRWRDSWRGGRRLLHGGGRDGPPGGNWQGNWSPWGPNHNSNDATRLMCTECDTGYVLKTRRNGTEGHCRCAPGWGVVPLDSSTDSDADAASSRWWETRKSSFTCVDCSAEGKVPLTDKSGLRLTWDGSNWVLVLASDVPAGWGPDGHSWHMGWRWWGVTPPFIAGQCVSCPAGSAPNEDSTQCVADGTTAPNVLEPSPSPAPSPDSSPPEVVGPSPSPAPSAYGSCIVITPEDTTYLQETISATCSADDTDTVSLDVFAWSDDPALMVLWFATPGHDEIMSDNGAGGYVDSIVAVAECSKLSGFKGQLITVNWLANDTGLTCSPASGTFEFTVPAWTSASSSSSNAATMQAASEQSSQSGVVEAAAVQPAASAIALPVRRVTGGGGGVLNFKQVAGRDAAHTRTVGAHAGAAGVVVGGGGATANVVAAAREAATAQAASVNVVVPVVPAAVVAATAKGVVADNTAVAVVAP